MRLWLVVAILCAQHAIAAQVTLPVHDTGPVIATSAFTVPTIFGLTIRPLSDGKVLVNDVRSRQVILLDAKLQNPVVVLDSAVGMAHSYGSRNGELLAFAGDSSLFMDVTSRTFLVIDPNGKIARTMAVVGSGTAVIAGDLSEYRRHYSSIFGIVERHTYTPRPAFDPSTPRTYLAGDTALVVATGLAARTFDTLARVSSGQGAMYNVAATGRGTAADPLPLNLTRRTRVFDSWTVIADGSVAIIRGRDYRMEFLGANGTRTSPPRLPFNWIRMTDAAKALLADSLNRDNFRADSLRLAAWLTDSAARGRPIPAATAGDGAAAARPPAVRPRPTPRIVQPADIPDYFGSLALASGENPIIMGDADNNVWILPRNEGDPPGLAVVSPVYDVVNREGKTIDRVRVPAKKTLAGFGPKGVVYFLVPAGAQPGTPTSYRIERASVR